MRTRMASGRSSSRWINFAAAMVANAFNSGRQVRDVKNRLAAGAGAPSAEPRDDFVNRQFVSRAPPSAPVFPFAAAVPAPRPGRRCAGKPSSRKPPQQRRQRTRSPTMSSTISSGTSSPRRMNPSAWSSAGLRSPSARHLAARKTSPVDRWQAPSRSESNSACVPLPTPGAPSSTSRQVFPGGSWGDDGAKRVAALQPGGPVIFCVHGLKLTTKAACLQWERPILPKDVSLLPKSAKCAGRNSCRLPENHGRRCHKACQAFGNNRVVRQSARG